MAEYVGLDEAREERVGVEVDDDKGEGASERLGVAGTRVGAENETMMPCTPMVQSR